MWVYIYIYIYIYIHAYIISYIIRIRNASPRKGEGTQVIGMSRALPIPGLHNKIPITYCYYILYI